MLKRRKPEFKVKARKPQKNGELRKIASKNRPKDQPQGSEA